MLALLPEIEYACVHYQIPLLNNARHAFLDNGIDTARQFICALSLRMRSTRALSYIETQSIQ